MIKKKEKELAEKKIGEGQTWEDEEIIIKNKLQTGTLFKVTKDTDRVK